MGKKFFYKSEQSAGWEAARDVAREAVNSGSLEVNHPKSDGKTLFFSVVVPGQHHAARIYLEAGADTNIQDSMGQSALHGVINNDFLNNKAEKEPCVRMLLE